MPNFTQDGHWCEHFKENKVRTSRKVAPGNGPGDDLLNHFLIFSVTILHVHVMHFSAT